MSSGQLPPSQEPDDPPGQGPPSPQPSRYQAGHVRTTPWPERPAAPPRQQPESVPPPPQPVVPSPVASPAVNQSNVVPPLYPPPPNRALLEARSLAVSIARGVVSIVNPIRAAFGVIAIVGAVLFVPNFFGIRLDDRWPWEGWLCRGVWPVVWLLLGLVAIVIGAFGIRIWNYAKWQDWWQNRRTKRTQPTAPGYQAAAVP